MRATGRLCALLGLLLALQATAVAQAKIRPLPKPAGVAVAPAAGHSGSHIAPVSRPQAHTAIRPARRRVAIHRGTAVRRTTTAFHRPAFVPAASHGGRERTWRVLSAGGRDSSAIVAAILPTPLGIVGSGEALPVYRYPWPAWKVVLLTLLAVIEAFVLVSLVRSRRFARIAEL